MKKIFALMLALATLAACDEPNPEYDTQLAPSDYETELTQAYATPLITVEKNVGYYGERRIEIFNNSDAPIAYIANEIAFDVDYTEQDIDVWKDINTSLITNAIEDHIFAREGELIQPNESIILIIDMASHPYDVNFNLSFDIGGEEIIQNIALRQNDQ